MRHWLIRIVIFGFLGTIINITVAWGCASLIDPLSVLSHGRSLKGFNRFVHGDEWYGITVISWPSKEVVQPQWHAVLVCDSDELKPLNMRSRRGSAVLASNSAIATGWPMRTFWSHQYYLFPDTKNIYIRQGIQLPDSWQMILPSKYFLPKVLPIGVILPGFIINSTSYALLILIVTVGPSNLRRHRRRRRGLCVKCAYDISHADHEACPECGEV